MIPFSTFKQAHSVLLIVLALSERLKLNIFSFLLPLFLFLSFTSHRSFSVFVSLSLQHARTHTNVKRTSSSLTYVPSFFLGRSTHTHTRIHPTALTHSHARKQQHTRLSKNVLPENSKLQEKSFNTLRAFSWGQNF